MSETTRVTIVINPNAASGKTRRRVKSCGPLFDVAHNGSRPDEMLVRSVSTGWSGWLPLAEIKWELAAAQD